MAPADAFTARAEGVKYKWTVLLHATVPGSTQEAEERVCQMGGERRGCLEVAGWGVLSLEQSGGGRPGMWPCTNTATPVLWMKGVAEEVGCGWLDQRAGAYQRNRGISQGLLSTWLRAERALLHLSKHLLRWMPCPQRARCCCCCCCRATQGVSMNAKWFRWDSLSLQWKNWVWKFANVAHWRCGLSEPNIPITRCADEQQEISNTICAERALSVVYPDNRVRCWRSDIQGSTERPCTSLFRALSRR